MKKIHNNSFFGTETFYDSANDIYVTKLPNKSLSSFYEEDYFSTFYKRSRPTLGFVKKIVARLFFTPPEINALSEYRLFKNYIDNTTAFLEIGAGNGDMLKIVQNVFSHVTAIEMDQQQRKKLESSFPSVIFSGDNFDEATFEKKFSCIYLRHVLEHVVDYNFSIKKIASLLDNSGVVMITVPNASNSDILKVSIERHPHTFHFTHTSLTNACKEAGLQVLHCETYDITNSSSLLTFVRRMLRISNLTLNKNKQGEHLVLIAKK